MEKYYEVFNIVWDTDDIDVDLPEEVNIPKDDINDEEEIADWLSDVYGWLVESFDYSLPDEEEEEEIKEPLSVSEMWDILLNYTSEEVLRVVTDINGYNEETMCDILYAITGYHDFDQLQEVKK